MPPCILPAARQATLLSGSAEAASEYVISVDDIGHSLTLVALPIGDHGEHGSPQQVSTDLVGLSTSLCTRIRDALASSEGLFDVILVRAAVKIALRPADGGLSLELGAGRVRLLSGKRQLWKANYDAHAQASLSASDSEGVALHLGGVEVMSLSVAGAGERDALLLLFREFSLRTCERRWQRWAGDSQLARAVRDAIEADQSRKTSPRAGGLRQTGTAAILVPFSANRELVRATAKGPTL